MAKRVKSISRDQYDRVTEILSPFSGYQNAPPEILDAAKDRGEKLHEYAHSFIYEIGLWGFDHAIEGYIKSLEQFWGEGYPVLMSEERLYCDELQITGKFDALIKMDDKLTLIDWKTSYAPNKTWPLQASAYHYLLKKNGYDAERIIFVKLDRKGEAPKLYEYAPDFDLFLKCYELYHLFFKGKSKSSLIED